jgi:hypothetical protein
LEAVNDLGRLCRHGVPRVARPRVPDGLIDIAAAILADRFVLCCDVGGEHDGHCDAIDLRDEDALAEELTSEYSPGTVQLRPWGGSSDRRVCLADIR